MRTIPVTLRDMVDLGMGGQNWQSFVDHYEEKFDAISVEGFDFDPVSIGYTWAQMLSKVGAQVLPTYVDPESEGYEKPLGQLEGATGNIPTQKLFYSVNRVILREKMQLVQKYGNAVMDDEMRDVMFGLLDEGTDGLIQSFVNALNHQRHQVVSKGQFTIDAVNNPRGLKGITIGFNMPAANKDVLTGTARWWTSSDHVKANEGKDSDPLMYLKNRRKAIRRTLTGYSRYEGPLGMEISQDLWDDMLTHSKVLYRLAANLYPTISDDTVRLTFLENNANEDRFKEIIRKFIGV